MLFEIIYLLKCHQISFALSLKSKQKPHDISVASTYTSLMHSRTHSRELTRHRLHGALQHELLISINMHAKGASGMTSRNHAETSRLSGRSDWFGIGLLVCFYL